MGIGFKHKGNSLQVLSSRIESASTRATDLRGGAALVIASLVAEGESLIEGTEVIERGYERLPEKLLLLGGRIEVR
jgi:UDP-N-acetylglucosamine 1-carboxyvinyltransferase